MAKETKEVLIEDTTADSKCQCGCAEPKEDSIVWGKVMVAKLTVLDKIINGLENGANVEHCLTLSNIYKNLCN